MIGTLASPTVTSLRLPRDYRSSLPGPTRSGRKMTFASRSPFKYAIHAFTETAVPAMETRRSASLYEVLRIKKNASPVEIKAAYRSLAKVYHPDSSHSEADGPDFIQIHNAYATLSDPTARALYDLSLGTGFGRRRSFEYSVGNGNGYGNGNGNRPGFYPTRRWETDQCW